jgi:hypothetical protein
LPAVAETLKVIYAMGSENLEPWQVLCAERRQKQLDSIPQEWLILKPSDDRLNVISIPEECGLLSSRELEITNTLDVDALLSKLASGEWSSVEVTTAFYKRAIIAHQLVRSYNLIHNLRDAYPSSLKDELPDRNLCGARFRTGGIP